MTEQTLLIIVSTKNIDCTCNVDWAASETNLSEH